ncbi:MAG: hypothetical protein ACFFCW_43645, partial [Candidatus Hodarchaeota archaeon]
MKEITRKERERILIRMVAILLAFFVVAIVVTAPMPTESRLLPFVAVVLSGMFCGGVYASRKFARNFEEFV